MPYFKPNAFVGLAAETTRNTPIAPSAASWIPSEAPDWTPDVTWLKDASQRGSAVDIYSEQAGVQHDEIDMKGMVYLDTFPNLLRAILGSTDTTTTAPTSTTLSAAAAAASASVTTTGIIAAGSSIAIQLTNGSYVGAVTGTQTGTAGSYITPITPALPTQYGAANGATVSGLTKHTLSLLNSVAVGSQPPSYTVEYFTAGEAGNTTQRSFAGSMLSDLSLSFAVEAAMSFDAKWIAQSNGTATSVAPSFSNEFFIPAWSCAVQLGGAASAVVQSASIDMKRGTEPIFTLGSKFPYRVWDGPLAVSGKVSLILESGDTTIQNGTNRDIEALDFLFTEPASGHTVDLHMTQVQLQDPKINWGKDYLVVDANFVAEGNSTDSVGGGYAQIKAVCSNAQATAY